MKSIVAALFLLIAAGVALADDAAKAHIGAGGELIIGGFDPNSFETGADSAKGFADAVPNLKSLGVTSQEIYVRWNLCEVAPGKWDWSVYDRYADICKKNNLKWVPFLICGSPYSLPDWYYKKPGSQGYVCLEHHEESDVQSLWNPEMRSHVAQFVKAFCEHYRDGGEKGGTVESILLGVSGNYGEAIYAVSGNDWTAERHGNYHSHPGFWAGDPFAVKDFAATIKKRYGTNEKLKFAWGDKAPAIDDVKPFEPQDAPNDRARIDFIDWYVGSMTDYAKFWLTETRKNFKGEIYLCTGGHAPPMHGSDFGDQCKIAAEIGGGVRITNENSDYNNNFAVTRWVASASAQYGNFFSFEPAGGVDANGVVTRVYNVASTGAKGLHYYYGNLFDNPAATANFVRSAAEFQQHKPIVEIAVYYPNTSLKLSDDPDHYIYRFFHRCKALRDQFDFNYVSDQMIRDGGLDRYKAIIVLQGEEYEPDVAAKLNAWATAGGTFIAPRNVAKSLKVLGNRDQTTVTQTLWQKTAGPEIAAKSEDDHAFCDYALQQLLSDKALSPNTHAMLAADGKDDGLFVAVMQTNELLWFNSTDKEQTATNGQTVPAHSIVAQPLKNK